MKNAPSGGSDPRSGGAWGLFSLAFPAPHTMAERIDWLDDGTPYSPRFGDRYHSEQGGIAQAREVFLHGCGLPQAWAGAPQWRILETGFGLGLNFLVTWAAWRADPARPTLLHFVSLEAWPVSAADLLRAAERHPELLPLARELHAQYWGLLPGVHRLWFDGGRVLLIGHSLGSVIAYDALWELSHLENHPGKVDLFLTLGSPLGMRFVQDRLLGFRQRERRFPCNIRRWINVAAHGDLTALDPELRDDFLPMLGLGCTETIADRHRGVFNYFRNEHGLNEHRSYGYLVEPHVACTVAGWWWGDGALNAALAGTGGMA